MRNVFDEMFNEMFKDNFKNNAEDVREEMEKVIKTGQENRARQKYIDAINAAIDERRNERLGEVIFGSGTIDLKKVIEVVDNYDKLKEKIEKAFKEATVVKQQ